MYKVLFIHPDQKLIQLYRPLLAQHFLVDSTHDGLAGLRLIRINRPEVIISDYQLPKLSGLSLLKFVRQQPRLISTPFIFFSNHPDVESALACGANDWLRLKFTSPEMLVDKIYQHLKLNIKLLNQS